MVDDRPVALVFPASRRVVLGRLGKLLGADEVRLPQCDEVDRIFGDHQTGESRPLPDLRTISVLMDASLWSAKALEIQSCGLEGPVCLTLEDWLSAANPGLGFFTEPDHEQS
jgi:prolyl-tRNA editing enzyme YbaK/EbsC (Cys-tRNA(Pro) deacylase)